MVMWVAYRYQLKVNIVYKGKKQLSRDKKNKTKNPSKLKGLNQRPIPWLRRTSGCAKNIRSHSKNYCKDLLEDQKYATNKIVSHVIYVDSVLFY